MKTKVNFPSLLLKQEPKPKQGNLFPSNKNGVAAVALTLQSEYYDMAQNIG